MVFSFSKSAGASLVKQLPVFILAVLLLVLVSFRSVTNDPSHSQTDHVPTFASRADWAVRPSYCDAIISNPQPFSHDCKRDMTTMRCSQKSASKALVGHTTMFSLAHQDFYLYTRHFKRLKRRGTFAEVAAKQAVQGSNSIFLERCLDWNGICVEGNPKYYQELYVQRRCAIVPTCVSDEDGREVEFLLMNEAGGIADTNANVRNEKWNGTQISSLMETCVSMKTVFRRHDVRVLDYLSLDVEGHELFVLMGIDWDVVKINVMTIEITSRTLREIQPFLEQRGYVRHTPNLNEVSLESGLLKRDAIFLHKDVVWGKPV